MTSFRSITRIARVRNGLDAKSRITNSADLPDAPGVILDLTVSGDPIAKGRPRTGKAGNTYTPPRTRSAESYIRAEARKVFDRDPVDCRVGLVVEFYCATNRRTDGDNMLKLVTDALNKTVYVDDGQIEECFYRVHRGVGTEFARTEVNIYEL